MTLPHAPSLAVNNAIAIDFILDRRTGFTTADLERHLDCTDRTARRVVARLLVMGLVEKERNPGFGQPARWRSLIEWRRR